MTHDDITGFQVTVSRDLAAYPPAVVPGQVLAERYEVGERIGGGGMADVFRARDRLLRRNVAVKVTRPHLAPEDACRRMLREARATAAVEHPHILRVSDFGTIGTSAYIVTELLTGLSLSELLKMLPEHRLDWYSALTLLLPALDALEQAHRHGLIHRDLKPDNLFVHRRDQREVLIVLDLGIAKVAPTLGGTGHPATGTGRVLGTPAYMSPEQASGMPIDQRADIYSIGMTLYRMLAGRLPFATQPGDHALMLMARNIYDAPQPLDEVALGLPPGLSEIVMQTLAKAPAERPSSTLALAETLAPYLRGVPMPVLPPLGRAATVHRVARLAMSVGLIALLIALGEPLAASPEPRRLAHEPREPDLPVTPRPITIPPSSPPPKHAPTDPGAAPEPQPEPPPGARPSRRTQPRAAEALAQVLAEAAPAIQACIAGRGALDRRPLHVRMSLGTDGRVTGASIPDPAHADMLGKCVVPRLLQLRFAAGPRQALVHAFAVGGSL